jgi:hypothetical protein
METREKLELLEQKPLQAIAEEEHSTVPGLQELVIMTYRHFGQFWNEPRPWDNYRIKVRALFCLSLSSCFVC